MIRPSVSASVGWATAEWGKRQARWSGRAARMAARCLLGGWIVMAGGNGCQRDSGPMPPTVRTNTLDAAMADLVGRTFASVEKDRRSAEAWGRLGQVYHALEFMPEARVCYERAAALAPRSPKWPHLLGISRVQDEPEKAIENWQTAAALASSMTNDSSRVRLAQALVERGRYAEALPVLDQLLAAMPGHAAALLEKGRIQLARQELAAGAASVTGCLTNRFTRRAALVLLGQIRQREGDAAAADRLVQEGMALERPPDWPDPHLAEVQALRWDRQQAADQINALLVRGRLAEAGARLERMLAAFPQDAEGLLLLGRLRYLEKRCPEAEAALRQHLAVQTNSINGLMQLSLALLCQERWSESAITLRNLLRLKPEFAPAHSNLAFALARMGDSAGAIRSYQEALRFNPGDMESHLALAEEFGLIGRAAEGWPHLERAASLAPNDPRLPRLREKLR
jgi:tetratricopeptide (TPR) repeat protein